MTEQDTSGDERTPAGTLVYREPARTWTSLWLLALGIAVVAAVDRIALGAVPVVGWILGGAAIVGVYALFVQSARSTRSLVLTSEELWVGDEMLPRADIVGVGPVAPRRGGDDVMVLGWPTGMPRAVRGVTVRLVDERDVAVPTRDGERLRAALGVGGRQPRSIGDIRPADDEDLALLADIDSRAEILFRIGGYDLPEIEFATDELDNAAAVFVVETPPVAFIWLREVDGLAYVEEVSVLPGSMRKGVGTALLEHACDWAREAGFPAVVLTTFADVPWNGPYYRARGFAEVDAPPPGVAAIRERETENGLDAVGRRIVMRRELAH